MKKCTICKIEKPLSQFNKNRGKKDGLQTHCRDCNRVKSRAYYKDNAAEHKRTVRKRSLAERERAHRYVWEYLLSHPCPCGESDPIVLEFDHLDQFTKTVAISRAITNGWSNERLAEEIAKCRVLCANCHRRHTAKQLGWYKFLGV